MRSALRTVFVHESKRSKVSSVLIVSGLCLLGGCSASLPGTMDGGALDAAVDPVTDTGSDDSGMSVSPPVVEDAGRPDDTDDPQGDGDAPGGDGDAPGGDGDWPGGDGDQPGDGDSPGDGDAPDGPNDDELEWHNANLTNFISYPEPDSDECKYFNGCDYPGYFAGFNGMQQSKEWVRDHNILAVHSKDFDTYKFKTLRIRNGGHEIDAVVYDLCSDHDCSGCCTNNSSETGFLIDMEVNTLARYGGDDGVVEWACIDCN
jgi:hypothetical protein